MDTNLAVDVVTLVIVATTTLAGCLVGLWRWHRERNFFTLKLQRKSPSLSTFLDKQYDTPRGHLYIEGRDVEIALSISTRQSTFVDRCELSFIENNSFWWWRRRPPSFYKASISAVWDIDADEEAQKNHHPHYRAFHQPVRDFDPIKGKMAMTYVPARELLKGDVLRLRVGISSTEAWSGWIRFSAPNPKRHWSHAKARVDMFWSAETRAREAATRERMLQFFDEAKKAEITE